MKKIKGTYTALVTPFDQDDMIDIEGLKTLLDMQIRTGVEGVVLMGTTGESPTLSSEEREIVLSTSRKIIPDHIAMIAGTGSNSTKQTIANTLQAEALGADGVLIVTPYYNKPTQEGIFRHFAEIANASAIPIVAYNSPGRSGTNMSVDTVKRLCDIPNVIGIKESSGNISHTSDIIEMCKNKRPDFSVVTGDDPLTLPSIALGALGVISVISNLMPDIVKAMVDAALYGDILKAQELHYFLMPFVRAAFLESNPIPIKAALALKGHPGGKCRLPLCQLSRENAVQLATILKSYE